MKYPKHVTIDGVKYPINTDFRVALKCFDIINDENISDTERTYAVVYKLFGFIPKDEDMPIFVEKVEKYLACGESQEQHKERKKDMDFEQDFKYLVASFMSDYHINLVESDMHWYQFINLIQGFTENSVMNRVRDLRNYDLSEVKDQKQRNKIIKAQQSVALKSELTQEEQEAIDEFESLFR
ncbi:Gp15 family bacteriophage protein [Candidatus Stoquefichus sp. SB1]|uniref:Gp15 family bacteriophage protein n=1 Tax=Candidatus Stoquefichus sp. SB1 TaxID=1658109 RepID=UPI00067E77F7|nr:Gp15 family bacteriophage protein [Candidatus Stoquefichus sp. SB1]